MTVLTMTRSSHGSQVDCGYDSPDIAQGYSQNRGHILNVESPKVQHGTAAGNVECRRGYSGYRNYFAQEQRIGHSTHQILTAILLRLKKIKRITIADWRSLATAGESYERCARRLFGNVLAPFPAGPFSDPSSFLTELFHIIGSSGGAQINQFCTGTHRFENGSHCPNLDDVRAQIYIPATYIGQMKVFIGNLRYLQVQIDVTADFLQPEIGVAQRSLRDALHAANRLRHLGLSIRSPPITDIIELTAFHSWLAGHFYPHLASLELRNWTISRADLDAFVTQHDSTLRRITLLDCQLLERSSAAGMSMKSELSS